MVVHASNSSWLLKAGGADCVVQRNHMNMELRTVMVLLMLVKVMMMLMMVTMMLMMVTMTKTEINNVTVCALPR